MFEAIVCSNGWDGVTAALQLVFYLEGDALSEHYGSPGRLYSRQFERTSRSPGDDPSVFDIDLETLARKAFTDADASVSLQLVWDSFIDGQAECSLHRHLDSLGPDTPIRDIVDRCRVWEGHAKDTDIWRVLHSPELPRTVYQVVDGSTDSKPEIVSADSDVIGLLMRHLLPTPAVSPPQAPPIPADRELLIQRLMEIVSPVADRQEPSVVCFSCGWSCAGRFVSFLATGMAGGSDGQRI